LKVYTISDNGGVSPGVAQDRVECLGFEPEVPIMEASVDRGGLVPELDGDTPGVLVVFNPAVWAPTRHDKPLFTYIKRPMEGTAVIHYTDGANVELRPLYTRMEPVIKGNPPTMAIERSLL